MTHSLSATLKGLLDPAQVQDPEPGFDLRLTAQRYNQEHQRYTKHWKESKGKLSPNISNMLPESKDDIHKDEISALAVKSCANTPKCNLFMQQSSSS